MVHLFVDWKALGLFLCGELKISCCSGVAEYVAIFGEVLVIALDDLADSEAIKNVTNFDYFEVGLGSGEPYSHNWVDGKCEYFDNYGI